MKTLLIILFCAVYVGCQSYQTRTYDVTVKNNSAGPITVWLTKDGPPFEAGWLAPEDIAIESPKQPARIVSGLIIPSGKEGFTGPRPGRFDPQTRAVLRVYAGQLTFEQMLASDRDEKRRVDLRLHPGRNDLVVTGGASAIEVKEAQPSP